MSSQTLDDLDIFGNPSTKVYDKSIFISIDKTSTLFGKLVLAHTLSNPTNDLYTLNYRSHILQQSHLFQNIQPILNHVKKNTSTFLSLFNEKPPLQHHFFETFKSFNYSSSIMRFIHHYKLWLGPALSFGIPMILLTILYLALRIYYKIKIPFKIFYQMAKTLILQKHISPFKQFGNASTLFDYLSKGFYLFSYLFSVYTNFKQSQSIYIETKELTSILIAIYQFYQNISTINNKFILSENHEQFQISMIKLKPIMKSISNLINDNHLKNDNIKWIPISYYGKVFQIYQRLLQRKQHLLNLFYYIGKIDSYHSNYQLIQNNKWEYVQWIDLSQPFIKIKQLKPIFIEEPQVNPVYIHHQPMILIGPNASGKSTFLKSLSISLLLAQSLSITPNHKMIMTPYDSIHTYMNIVDVKGELSLYQKQLEDFHKLLEIIHQNPNKKHFMVMDELFNGTNPKYSEKILKSFFYSIHNDYQYNKTSFIVSSHSTQTMNNHKIPKYSFIKYKLYKVIN